MSFRSTTTIIAALAATSVLAAASDAKNYTDED